MALLLAGPAGSGRTTAATAAAAALGLHLVPFNCHDLTSAAGGMVDADQVSSYGQLQASALLKGHRPGSHRPDFAAHQCHLSSGHRKWLAELP